jgi:hypothetical protein
MADISTLQQSLINAKKVMNKVDGGNFTKGSGSIPNIPTDQLVESLPPVQALPNTPQATEADRQDLTPKKYITEEKINKSKLPDVIKQAMIKNPIPEIPFNGSVGLTDDFLNGVKEQMEKQDIPVSSSSVESPVIPSNRRTSQKSNKLTSSNLKSLIKESVRELITEVVDDRIDEAINMKTSSDENFQFKVGDRIFYGKITSSKSIK